MGYFYTTAYAEELVKNNEKQAAMKLINKWNSGLGKQITAFRERFGKHGIIEKGGLRNSYLITPEKKKNIFTRQRRIQTHLERRLSRRKY